jgi:hypothetical protein
MLMTLVGCVTVSGSDSAEQTKAAATPAGECRRVYTKTSDPGYAEGEDARKVIVRYQGRLWLANRRGVEATQCSDTAADRASR